MYSWSFSDFFEPTDQVLTVDVNGPTSGPFAMPFDNYLDFRDSVTGEWTIEASFGSGRPDALLTFDVSGLPDSFPLVAPVITSPGESESVVSGQDFFPTLDPATVGPGFLSRSRFTSPDLTSSFETGGTYNGFRATLNPGVTNADFRFAYTNTEFVNGLESNLNGDQDLLVGFEYLSGSGIRTVNVTAVPEPGLGIALLGVAASCMIRRRRR
ncbi:MAG: PEP-CTERM sorting domain-containing protein [Rubripirellula sp.]